MTYNKEKMAWKRRRRNDKVNGSPPAVVASDSSKSSPGSTGIDGETKTPPVLTGAFREAIEKAADRARSELASKGKMDSMVFFMYEDGILKTMTLTLRGAQQQEALARRIREKVLAENVLAVITLTEMGREQQVMVLSGVTSGARASARVEYGFDKGTKAITSWKVIWLAKPVQNVFLDGIFDRNG